jgi:formyl-CoA transferase
VPSGRIYTVKDIAEDPHYRARGVIESVTSAGGLTVEVPGVVPKLSASPGAIHDRAPTLGEHTDAVLKQAGFDAAAIADLRARKVIA